MRRIPWLPLALAGLLATQLVLLSSMRSVESNIDAVLSNRSEIMTTYTSRWNSADGLKEVVTTRGTNETAAQHAARHKADVDALKAIYPPIKSNLQPLQTK